MNDNKLDVENADFNSIYDGYGTLLNEAILELDSREKGKKKKNSFIIGILAGVVSSIILAITIKMKGGKNDSNSK